ncbi:riboflavin synthase [Lawsonia intracellularis]|uniref:Riboflavin synthase n=1 Tax=Lawsonia intracellularis (strain PHE/MN1-00) TaxID=363253 RepID=Q1MS13_LAWIP|nr:riboflavin synthase [Lawsonia intracellularis]AGC49557.1 riboflavin synthase subunit alpha [Lawsonia intracellularis N343]KAA0205079.1 riboflavin synthase [Lawsonia intracellularis]MBZ3892395.1 riboflavin synthase [Lawsonia intracellularis]OMQ06219.1 riboflavin synthase [Lawsonia intracellularis]RBN32373.1 riboflavin synthase [Lawsonia intracellularis]
MFTGVTQGCGNIYSINHYGKEVRITVEPLFPLKIISTGESIAINGTCLTVEQYTSTTFTVYASLETLQRTNLGKLVVGNSVNLEQSIAVGERLNGHIVTGHIDCVATVQSIEKQGKSNCIKLIFPSKFSKEVVSKGSVTLDGISLTVNNCGSGFLEVNIIPATWNITTISNWKVGTHVNMETDIIAKYIYNMLNPIISSIHSNENKTTNITLDFLHKHGFY